MTKEFIIEQFRDLNYPTKGFEGWLSKDAPDAVFERIKRIDREPLTKVQLNQLLLLSLEAGISDGFFKYYWVCNPITHSYPVDKVDDFDDKYASLTAIESLKQLRWGIRRIFTDCLLYFGNINFGFNELKNKSLNELIAFFESKCFPTKTIKLRGRPLEFHDIAKDERYLISEMACKSYGDTPKTKTELLTFLKESYAEATANGSSNLSFKDLLSGSGKDKNINEKSRKKFEGSLQLFEFSADELLDLPIADQEDLLEKYDKLADKFLKARESALRNTDLYLSLVNDLDVYVATSMRTRNDFREMAETCQKIFKDIKLKEMYLRYFDPTMSAADGHEDKGLIECLMVKCAKVLIYTEGIKESYGKDAEAAMALSLGKPVIFLSPQRANFYKTVHPLTRLIDFNSGVAVGAIIADTTEQVAEILHRVFENKMEYTIEHTKAGYFKLKEKLTGSIVRLQTNNELLAKCFWNYYHNKK